MATHCSSPIFLVVCFCLALTAQQAMSHGYGYGRWGHKSPSYYKPYGGYGRGYGGHGGSYGSYGSHGSHGQPGSYGSQRGYGSYGNRGSGHTSYGNLGRPVAVSSGTHDGMRPGSQFQGSGNGMSPVLGVSGVGVQGVSGVAPLQGSGEVSHIHLVDGNSGVPGPVGPTFINSGGQEGVSDLLLGGASGTGVDVTQVDLRNSR
ncbi:heterogeneous nuclear ribonucleoprotein A3-like [Penaeus chinensis]|uniref:heterogeneous nuclear ribonucleoprotein A3-like n=1 Tax=Penaeus chinensis TaxID=139456 RepID=UPI001FB7782F|nr:heterogeneous nuclear ribonucleoprotein A3-like [Penaeus chinensis]